MTQELDSEKQNSEARNAEIKILHGLISEYDSKLAGFPRENESMVADKSRTTDQAKAINERVEGKT